VTIVRGAIGSIQHLAGVERLLCEAMNRGAHEVTYRREADGQVVTVVGMAAISRAVMAAERQLARAQLARLRRAGLVIGRVPGIGGYDKRILTTRFDDRVGGG
jgi:hypothetical protein